MWGVVLVQVGVPVAECKAKTAYPTREEALDAARRDAWHWQGPFYDVLELEDGHWALLTKDATVPGWQVSRGRDSELTSEIRVVAVDADGYVEER